MAAPAAGDEAKAPCSKEVFKPADVPAKIDGLRFTIQSPEEIHSSAVLRVHAGTLYQMPQRTPTPEGVLDARLGVSNKRARCATCGLGLKECAGHFGFVKLPLPVFHPGYFIATLKALQAVCKCCGRVLLATRQRAAFLRQLQGGRRERNATKAELKTILLECKKAKVCPHCGAANGVVKKLPASFKLVHDPYTKREPAKTAFTARFDGAIDKAPDIANYLDRALDDLNPARVLRIFSRIPDADVPLLGLATRPEHLLIVALAAPPVCIRPSVEMDAGGGTNEDDATTRLLAVCDMSVSIRKNLDAGIASWETIMEQWDFLQVQCAKYINSEARLTLEYQKHDRKSHSRGFVQRLKGKQGRFRGNLSGKRVDFSGRTVISPDPNLRIDQVCVPRHQAAILTFPEVVTPHNIEAMRRLVARGPLWPGANQLVRAGGAETFVLKASRRRDQLAKQLEIGDIVERHCNDGDVVLFNRQPSLHRISLMALRAVVMAGRTLRFNECVCNPFNADFDGDEMNIHLPQTQEAKAEAIELMGTHANLRTPKSGEVMICANQDFLTAAYLITSKDRFFTRAQFAQLCGFMDDARGHVDLPPPAIMKPLELWTGKQLLSMLLRPSAACPIFVNIQIKEKGYTSGEHLCPKDGFVAIVNSELLCGRVGKALLGGSKAGLFSMLAARYSPATAGLCMNRLSKLAARYVGEQGFSIGITDVTPATELLHEKAATLDSSYGVCARLVSDFERGELELLPGCDADESLEHRVQGVLNNVRDIAGKVCMRTLHRGNAALAMATCGAKGSPINIAQMVACVGQQSVGGKRCADGFAGRTIPHFPRGDKSPAGKGFVASSFHSGLSATEFIFHTMAGREGLVDTAVKTADTGYMSRRLMKALEDLYLCYDRTVRNSAAAVVQLTYGDDCLDPIAMEGPGGQPLDLDALLRDTRARVARPRDHAAFAPPPLPAALAAAVDARLAAPDIVGDSGPSSSFATDLARVARGAADDYAVARAAAALPRGERGDEFLEFVCGLSGLSEATLEAFVGAALAQYALKASEPSTPLGAIAAQSLGEPGTQMTLKTFHFAGVASMNVTLGVPRLKEIINASKTISTPIMHVALDAPRSEVAARGVKAALERATLRQLSRRIEMQISEDEPCVLVVLDTDAIAALGMPVDVQTVRRALIADRKSKVKEHQVRVLSHSTLALIAPDDNADTLSPALQAIIKAAPDTVVTGIPTIARAVIQSEEDADDSKGGRRYALIVEGTDFRAVVTAPGVDGRRTESNHIVEVAAVLGIEAARTKIMTEIRYIFDQYGMGIDHRHVMLLADLMTCKGAVLGITRFGIVDMKESILHSASFERTTDQLFEAAAKGMEDHVSGVSESIILGLQMPIGTGLFGLRHAADAAAAAAHAPPVMAA